MRKNRDLRAALAVLAAVSGTGFSSGREVALFFSQMGRASWLGMGFAPAAFGALCFVVCRLARETDARSFPGVCLRALGARPGAVIGLLHGLMVALTAGVMLSISGALAALTLPLRHAFWMGLLLAMLAALLLNLGELRRLPAMGAAVAALCGLFFLGLALDGRPAAIYRNYATELRLSGSASAALLFATLHAAMNASVASGVVVRFADEIDRPARFAALCGALMALPLCLANAALLRGGARLLSQPLPTVALGARWGIAGYWLNALTMALGAVSTLAAALGTLAGGRGAGKGAILGAMSLGCVMATWMGFERFIDAGYPALGCAAALAMAMLACCLGLPLRRPEIPAQGVLNSQMRRRDD